MSGTDRAAGVVLLTNDDGYGAPGLEALRALAGRWGEVWVVAPAGQCSNCGHSVTTGRTIPIEQREERGFVVGGTPADCVRLALSHIIPRAGLVISGINEGGNLGVDLFYSGTVAAAREAMLMGRPGIAVSHYLRRGVPLDWEKAAGRASRVIDALRNGAHAAGTFWNVNLPHLDPGSDEPDWEECPVEVGPLPVEYELFPDGARYKGDYQARVRAPGSDVDVCFSGRIAVSRIHPIDGLGGAPRSGPAGKLADC